VIGQIERMLYSLIIETAINNFDDIEFAQRLVPLAKMMAADAAAVAARADAAAVDAAARDADAADAELLFFASEVEKILIDMNVPGVQWLSLLD
jgi:hypothetical protein